MVAGRLSTWQDARRAAPTLCAVCAVHRLFFSCLPTAPCRRNTKSISATTESSNIRGQYLLRKKIADQEPFDRGFLRVTVINSCSRGFPRLRRAQGISPSSPRMIRYFRSGNHCGSTEETQCDLGYRPEGDVF